MNESKITTRYAKALFKLAQEQNLLDTIKHDLELIDQVFKIQQFKQFITSPIIPISKKQQTVSELLKDKVHKYTLDFLLLLIENRRERFIDIIILDFKKLYRQFLNITEVELTTAVELDNQTKQKFIEILQKITNSQIELQHKVDPQIIGGFIIKIEDRRLDASISTQLKNLKKHIVQ